MREAIKPIIPGASKSKPEASFHSFSITNQEKNILYRKCRSLGMDNYTAGKRVKELCDYLKELKVKLHSNKKLSPEDINERFKKSFEKMVMRLDGEIGE